MNGRELFNILNGGAKIIVQFTSVIEDWDGYFDANMIAQIISVQLENDQILDELVKVTFYCEPWDEENSRVEKYNYWDNNRNAVLNSRQVGLHPEKNNWEENYWFGAEDNLPFKILSQNALQDI